MIFCQKARTLVIYFFWPQNKNLLEFDDGDNEEAKKLTGFEVSVNGGKGFSQKSEDEEENWMQAESSTKVRPLTSSSQMILSQAKGGIDSKDAELLGSGQKPDLSAGSDDSLSPKSSK